MIHGLNFTKRSDGSAIYTLPLDAWRHIHLCRRHKTAGAWNFRRHDRGLWHRPGRAALAGGGPAAGIGGDCRHRTAVRHPRKSGVDYRLAGVVHGRAWLRYLDGTGCGLRLFCTGRSGSQSVSWSQAVPVPGPGHAGRNRFHVSLAPVSCHTAVRHNGYCEKNCKQRE